MSDTLSPANDRFPLTSQQEFLRLVDHADGNGPFGPRYTIVGGWRITGPLDLAVLRTALLDVVVRHESLRTELVLDDGEPYQRVLAPIPPELVVRELPADGDRDTTAERFVNDVEAGQFGIEVLPHLRAVVGRFDSDDAVFVLDAHHTAIDGWSAQVVMRDLAACYAARHVGEVPRLPAVSQPRDYVSWQRANAGSPAMTAARTFWRENLAGASMVAVPTDHPRADGPFVTGWHRFVLDERFRIAAQAMAGRTRSTLFMVLLAAHVMYLREQTGRTDLVVPTFTPGRGQAWTQDIVGSFYNFLPLRIDITGCTEFTEVVAKVRAACLAAYAHEVPFLDLVAEAPDLMSEVVEPNGAACVFQVVQSPFMMNTGTYVADIRFTAMRRRVLSAPVGSQLPDGGLWALEVHPDGDIVGKAGYTTNVFTEGTMVRMVEDYRRILGETIVVDAA